MISWVFCPLFASTLSFAKTTFYFCFFLAVSHSFFKSEFSSASLIRSVESIAPSSGLLERFAVSPVVSSNGKTWYNKKHIVFGLWQSWVWRQDLALKTSPSQFHHLFIHSTYISKCFLCVRPWVELWETTTNNINNGKYLLYGTCVPSTFHVWTHLIVTIGSIPNYHLWMKKLGCQAVKHLWRSHG